MTEDERKTARREATRRYREKQKALGVTPKPRTEESKMQNRLAIAKRRAEAAARGVRLPGDNWASENPDAHRANVARWRKDNLEYAQELTRIGQGRRRSTPWGRINNRLVSVLHRAVRAGTGKSKYVDALGYSWTELRAHLEARFTPEMTWANWGDVWELDHIAPLSTFHYTSLDDPRFKECWRLANLRPFLRHENAAKGAKLYHDLT